MSSSIRGPKRTAYLPFLLLSVLVAGTLFAGTRTSASSPAIDLSVSVSDRPAIAGYYHVYTINVTNNGPVQTAATLTSTLSANAVFQKNGNSLEAYECYPDDSNQTTCILSIAEGTTTTLQISVTVPASGTLTNTVNVTGALGDPDLSNNTVVREASIQPLPAPTGSACATPPSGAIAWYPGDGNANDIIAGQNGTLRNGTTFAPGIVGQALRFDNAEFWYAEDSISKFVEVWKDPEISFLGNPDSTIAFWANFNDPTRVSEAFVGEPSSWTFMRELGVLFYGPYNADEPMPVVSFPWDPQPGQWYHLAVTRNGSTFTLYINGIEVSSSIWDLGLVRRSNWLTIGHGYGWHFDGLLDEVGAHNRALSQAEIHSIFNAGSYGQCKTASFTGSGENVEVQTTGADLTFSEVTGGGTTTVTALADPAEAGEVPGGFAVSELAAYEVQTTATFTGTVTLGFLVPFPDADNDGIDDVTGTAFTGLRIMHREQTGTDASGNPVYGLVDRTSGHDLAARKVYATVTSFSPFYLARQGHMIKSLFDKSKAYKGGSTVPVKVQLLDSAGANVSSANTTLAARGLRLIGGNTTTGVIDVGNANADGNFRYDARLQGYVFNLSTKALSAGKYVLSFYAGTDRSFFYTVTFEIR